RVRAFGEAAGANGQMTGQACALGGARFEVTVPLLTDRVNHLTVCQSPRTACGPAPATLCTRRDRNGGPLDIVKLRPTPTATPKGANLWTPTPAPLQTCAPTGTPYCSNHCYPCPTIRENCPASACGACIENPHCDLPEVSDCPRSYSGCCGCALPT